MLDGKVAIITGAGNGLGKAYALLFASLGAKVVVNDLGGSFDGSGSGSSRPAEVVAQQIRDNGGEAVANFDSVEFGDKIVQTALDAFGKVDIVVNNAGILRDVTFHKMKPKDWDLIYTVHLKGTMSVTQAAYKVMREQRYGRIVNVSSAAGLYGNFGQVNYSAAKLGIVGFSKGIAIEGAKRNIKCNVIAPIAGSRMTETVLPEDLVKSLKPDYVAPFVAYLCSEKCPTSGDVFELGAGWISKLRWQRSKGHFFDLKSFDVKDVHNNFDKICDFSDGATLPTTTQDCFGPIMQNLNSKL